MKTYFILILGLGLCGCTAPGHLLTTGVGAAAGASAGHVLSRGSPLATAGGAALGALAGEGAWAWKTRTEQNAFQEGYTRGRADAAKTLYWRLQRQQEPGEDAPRYRRLTITIPAHREGDVLYETQTRTILIAE